MNKYLYIIPEKMNNIKQKTKIFRVNQDTGTAFKAIAELLNIDSDELLQALMSSYVSSVQNSIAETADIYPEFKNKYPFIKHPNTS